MSNLLEFEQNINIIPSITKILHPKHLSTDVCIPKLALTFPYNITWNELSNKNMRQKRLNYLSLRLKKRYRCARSYVTMTSHYVTIYSIITKLCHFSNYKFRLFFAEYISYTSYVLPKLKPMLNLTCLIFK